jgi:cbb3-type cytochrome oxidase subunit 3
MEFILGLLTMAVFLLCVYTAFKFGQKQTKAPSKVNTLTEDEERQKEQIKRYNEGFKELFSYDVEKALQPKKVYK